MSLSKLQLEISRCLDAQIPVDIWWRDDDLVSPSPQFEKLCEITVDLNAPVLCSIIPKHASNKLALNTSDPLIHFCQHGYAHVNHEKDHQLKNEFGQSRALDEVKADIQNGQKLLKQLEGSHLESVFVPPWNRFDIGHLPILEALGFTHISCYGFKSYTPTPSNIKFINTHFDITYWGTNQTYMRPLDEIYVYLAEIIKEYYLRYSQTKESEPIGILSHHRVLKDGDFFMLKELLGTLQNTPGVKFAAPFL